MQSDQLQYAGFWIRLGASLIDIILMMLIIIPLLVSIYGWGYFDSTELIAGPMDFLLNYILPGIATVLFWVYKQATPGKILLNLKVVDAETGGEPTLGQCIGRYFAYFLSMIPLCLGFIWVGFDKKKQGWHDKLSSTVITRPKNTGPKDVEFTG